MPDFDVNEGYFHASARRADPSLTGMPDDGISVDGRVAPYGLDVAPEHMLEAVLFEDVEAEADGDDSDPAGEALLADWPALIWPPHKLPEPTPIVRRARHSPIGHRSRADAGPERRVGVRMIARRRRLARRACPFGWTVRVLSTPPRHRRRLWTSCHGQPRQTPGSLS
jgi:hypothetical protein